ncbi:hypothetical protein OH77DRAFT_296605 [Trametes cingulata]|nr:hypothetical protein OH77DRAFT_296605 [Trametes cingulata]
MLRTGLSAECVMLCCPLCPPSSVSFGWANISSPAGADMGPFISRHVNMKGVEATQLCAWNSNLDKLPLSQYGSQNLGSDRISLQDSRHESHRSSELFQCHLSTLMCVLLLHVIRNRDRSETSA